jgi:hypothetical protein
LGIEEKWLLTSDGDGAVPPDAQAIEDAAGANDAMLLDASDAAPCPEGQSRCGATCVETFANDAHCGYCGRVCSGCALGLCPSTPLHTFLGVLRDLRSNTTELYYSASNGRIRKVARTGGSGEVLQSNFGVVYIDLASTQVVYSSQLLAQVGTFPLAGGSVVSLADSQGTLGPVTTDAARAHVYFAVQGTPAEVRRVPIGGGPVTSIAELVGTISALHADDVYVYATVTTGADRGIVRMGLDGSNPTALVVGSANEVLVLGESVFYTDSSAVLRVARRGGPPTTIVGESANVLTGNATHLYFTSPGAPRRIRRVKHTGGPYEEVAQAPAPVTVLRLDGPDLFYAAADTLYRTTP